MPACVYVCACVCAFVCVFVGAYVHSSMHLCMLSCLHVHIWLDVLLCQKNPKRSRATPAINPLHAEPTIPETVPEGAAR